MTPLVRPLEDRWQGVLDAVLAARRAPKTADVARLAPRVAELSRAYNAGKAGEADAPVLPLEARIAFSFARDVPKGAGAVRELVASGALRVPDDRPLRVLDLGAGLGAITHGIVRALEAAGARGSVAALLVDEDARALAAAEEIAREAAGAHALALDVKTKVGRLAPGVRLGRFDVVVLGQVLSELDRGLDAGARVARHAELARDLLAASVGPGGALVVVEPALRDRTRHLHAVRDAVLAASPDLDVFAPCLHRAPCPALAAEGEWCHEDLAVDLPPWLVPLARAAGLRWQGLTFSYLVLRNERSAREETTPRRVRLRVVSERFVTKGKSELFGCTERGERLRLRLLDRDRTDANAAWEGLGRGDVATLSSPSSTPIDDRGRVGAHTAVDAHAITNL